MVHDDFDVRGEAEQASDGDLDRVLRPAQFEDFTGQRAAMDNLQVFVQAARQRGEALDHVLLHGACAAKVGVDAGIYVVQLAVPVHALMIEVVVPVFLVVVVLLLLLMLLLLLLLLRLAAAAAAVAAGAGVGGGGGGAAAAAAAAAA
ncbi:MAG: hypothetical protein ACPHZB_05785, partial [Flavobacteriales bacterium]